MVNPILATVPKAKEREIVERIKTALLHGTLSRRNRGTAGQILLGIGDDSAVIEPARGKNWAISADFFLEGVHFLEALHSPESVGFKALARATSDLAAMGASPRFFLLSIALPDGRTGQWLNRMLKGMRKAAAKYGMTAIGGDTSRYQAITVSITVIGEIDSRGRVVTRAGAKPGDAIYVSGTLGQAALGLELIRRGLSSNHKLQQTLRQHLYPEIQMELGSWLAHNRVASSMIDVSDGLSTDLGRICEASETGATIYMDKIPCPAIPAALHNLGHLNEIDIDGLALHGGDDYELLFTVPPQLEKRLVKAPNKDQIRRIGTIQRDRKILLVDRNGKTENLKPGGWDPFRK